MAAPEGGCPLTKDSSGQTASYPDFATLCLKKGCLCPIYLSK